MMTATAQGLAGPCTICCCCFGCYLSDNGLPPYVLHISRISMSFTPKADHWQDVLVGSIVGTVFSYFSYRQYYPPLDSEFSHRPYSPRIKKDSDETLPTHHGNSASNYPFAGTSDTTAPTLPQVQHTGNEEYELEGTVLRPHPPGSLEDMWRRDQHALPVQERSLETRDARYPVGGDIPSLSGSPRVPLPAHAYHGEEEVR